MELALEVRYYNLILGLFKTTGSKRRSIPDNLKSFIEAVKRESGDGKDPDLLACYSFLEDKDQYEELMGKLRITGRNYKLVEESPMHYPKAVKYLDEGNRIKDAVHVCTRHRDYMSAGKTYEYAGELVLAARAYRDGKCYTDAVRCFSQMGDKQGTARVYERMQEFDKALAIWKKLGKTKEVSRVLRKKNKKMANETQLALF